MTYVLNIVLEHNAILILPPSHYYFWTFLLLLYNLNVQPRIDYYFYTLYIKDFTRNN